MLTPRDFIEEKLLTTGADKILIKLITAVSEIDKATSPLQNSVNTLDVTATWGCSY